VKAKGIFYGSLVILTVTAALALALAASPRAASGASTEPVAAEQLQEEFAAVAARVNPMVVNIDVAKPVQQGLQGQFFQFGPDVPLPPELRDFFGWPQQPRSRRLPRSPEQAPKMRGMGSGVVIDAKNGYVLTNNHVVDDATEISVTLIDGKRYDAKLVGTDPRTDLAVVQIKADGLQEIQWGDSDALKVGYWVLAFGQPEGLKYTVTKGIVSALGRGDLRIIGAGDEIGSYENYIQTDAAINPGNSGGPLTDIHGRLVGINSAILTGGAPQFAGIGFAVPSNLAKKIVAQLIEKGEVVRGWIGVSLADMADRDKFPDEAKKAVDKIPEGTKGVYVAKVEPGQPAEAAGVRDNDVIVKFDGADITSLQQLRYLVADAEPGAKAEMAVLRVVGGKPETVDLEVEVAQQPKSLAAARSGEGVVSTDIGLTVQTLTGELAESLGYDKDEKGVVVAEIEPDSRAAKADLAVNDVIGQITYKGATTRVESAEGFNSALSKMPKDEPFVVLRKREGQTKFVKVE